MLISYIDPDGILCIAGQSDLVVKNGNHIRILDHKTNKKLKQKSYFDPKKKKYQMMKYPLNNIMDCNFLHYTLQLSLYAWMLQKQNPDLIIDELRIVHFTHDGEVNEYVLEYLKSDSKSVALVLLDLVMPEMDGFEVLKYMNKNHLIEEVPVMIISIDKDDKSIEKPMN